MKYYTWNDGNYTNGLVIGFENEKDAIIHAEKHHKNSFICIHDIDFENPEDIYTGE